MCFSAEASFTAAAVLGAIGVATLKQTPQPERKMIALLPLIFAIQQFSEGLVWLSWQKNIPENIGFYSLYFYLFIALSFWPAWTPLSLLVAETDQKRKWPLYLITGAGFVLAAINFYVSIKQIPSFDANFHHILYHGDAPSQRWIYLGIVSIPCLISSIPKMWIMGLLFIASFLTTIFAYDLAFVSVWCFFAAVLSIALFFILRTPSQK